ncbi:MAG: nucleotidyltransferase domain-containing protein [Deltaproteobacteria bacterium]|nr:nucleotidyltransferase domain-containing protein [Deltaproteobacteria bacterium]
MIENAVERLKAALAGRQEIRFAYLFGSLAKGRAGAASDVDVAVRVDAEALKKDYAYGYKAELTAHLMGCLKTNRVDVVLLNEAKPYLRSQVMRYGLLVLNNDEPARIRFCVETIRLYDDAKRLLAIQNGYMMRRIEEGRFGR